MTEKQNEQFHHTQNNQKEHTKFEAKEHTKPRVLPLANEQQKGEGEKGEATGASFSDVPDEKEIEAFCNSFTENRNYALNTTLFMETLRIGR